MDMEFLRFGGSNGIENYYQQPYGSLHIMIIIPVHISYIRATLELEEHLVGEDEKRSNQKEEIKGAILT